MKLVNIKFIHYSPKDSEEGIKELVIADDLEQAINYIDHEHLYNKLSDEDDDEPSGYSPPDEFWTENPQKRAEAAQYGLNINEYDFVEGSFKGMSLWLNNTTWEEISDLYYGATQYDWSKYQDVTEEDAAVLLRLRLAKDIRN